MAAQSNSTAKNDCDRLSEASLECCYLDTLLSVLEDIFGAIDRMCDASHADPQAEFFRPKARNGLNAVYMAQDKLAVIKRLTNEVEGRLNQRALGREHVQ